MHDISKEQQVAEPFEEARQSLAPRGDPPPTVSTPARGMMFCWISYAIQMLSRTRFHSNADRSPAESISPVICNMSLTLDSSWKYLFWLVATYTVMFCHAAPPCGTCSSARELPGGPPPLRNEVYPWSLDNLSPEHCARDDAANKIYVGLAKIH